MKTNQRALISLEVKKEERTYILMVPMGAPYGELYDAVFSMLEDVLEMSQNASKKMQPSLEPEIVETKEK